MDHSEHVRITSEEFTRKALEGTPFTARGREDRLGVASSRQPGSDDVGGFLGIRAKPVAITAQELDFMRDDSGDVHAITNWSKDQLREMPEHRH